MGKKSPMGFLLYVQLLGQSLSGKPKTNLVVLTGVSLMQICVTSRKSCPIVAFGLAEHEKDGEHMGALGGLGL